MAGGQYWPAVGWWGGEAAWPELAALGVAVGGVGKNNHGTETVSLLLNLSGASLIKLTVEFQAVPSY